MLNNEQFVLIVQNVNPNAIVMTRIMPTLGRFV
jgi:hypothetical protein